MYACVVLGYTGERELCAHRARIRNGKSCFVRAVENIYASRTSRKETRSFRVRENVGPLARKTARRRCRAKTALFAPFAAASQKPGTFRPRVTTLSTIRRTERNTRGAENLEIVKRGAGEERTVRKVERERERVTAISPPATAQSTH